MRNFAFGVAVWLFCFIVAAGIGLSAAFIVLYEALQGIAEMAVDWSVLGMALLFLVLSYQIKLLGDVLYRWITGDYSSL